MGKHCRLFMGAVSALVLVALAAAACGFSVSTARVTATFLGKGFDQDGNVVDPTDTFAPTDQTIHLVAKVANAPDDTTLKATWYVVEVEGNEPGLIDETTLTLSSGEDTADFTLSNNQPWPVGRYKVELYLNDELDKTMEFEVRD